MSAATLLAAIEVENKLEVIDTHTAGEPTRIVLETDTLPALEGDTMFERHTCAVQRWDTVRRRLVHEPRGQGDMFGAFVLFPTQAKGEIGVLFCDTKGFLTMCVHGSIAVSRVLMKIRRLQSLRLDTPAGIVEASVQPDDNGAEPVIIARNVPSFVSTINQHVMLNGRDTVFDIAFGGNFAALVDVERVGLEISPDRISELRSFGDALLKEINRTMLVQHPTQPEIQGVTLAYFYQASEHFSKISNIVVFGNKQVDRSPCGTGTSAMLAALVSRGRLALGQKCRFYSALGSEFVGHIGDHQDLGAGGYRFTAFNPVISARSHITGINRLVFEGSDPFKNGFLL